MQANVWLALQITFIGMGLVFAAIILLWGLMALLVRLTAERSIVSEAIPSVDAIDKQRAAIVAVTVALALSNQSQPSSRLSPPPTTLVSAWQAVMRANQLKQRGPVRK